MQFRVFTDTIGERRTLLPKISSQLSGIIQLEASEEMKLSNTRHNTERSIFVCPKTLASSAPHYVRRKTKADSVLGLARIVVFHFVIRRNVNVNVIYINSEFMASAGGRCTSLMERYKLYQIIIMFASEMERPRVDGLETSRKPIES
jgi:hypothetical protein